MKLLPSNLYTTSKSIVILFSILFMCITGLSSFVSAADLKAVPPVVTVNGKAMEQAELDKQIERILDSVKGRIPADQTDKFNAGLQGKIIDNFITRTLIEAECDKLKIKVTKKELDDKLNEYMKHLPKDMDLDAALKQASLKIKDLNDNISFELQIEKLIALKSKDQPVPTETEIKEFFDNMYSKQPNTPKKVHARHILIKTDSKETKQLKKERKNKILKLRGKLLQGADFTELAKENSDCPSGKTRGGDLGTFPRGKMIKALEDAAFSQKVNEIGQVIETRFGFHIIQVLEIIEAKTKNLEESRDNIINTLNQMHNWKFKKDLSSKLKKNAKIDYADAYKPTVK
jgi:parvulin-like peptidyl-prolyl isomerase